MFEHRQSEMESMLKTSAEFRRLYDKHQELDKRVSQAEAGSRPMDDLTLHQLKKEKLYAKDQLNQLMASAH